VGRLFFCYFVVDKSCPLHLLLLVDKGFSLIGGAKSTNFLVVFAHKARILGATMTEKQGVILPTSPPQLGFGVAPLPQKTFSASPNYFPNYILN